MYSDYSTIMIAFLAAANCSLLGCFLVLRKQTMIADALAHAILPGLVIGFIIGNQINGWLLLLGAISSGILMVMLVNFLKNTAGLSFDGAIGFSATFFFSVGMILLALFAFQVDLDPACVLYGELASAYFDVWVWRSVVMGPRAIYLLGGLLAINVLFIKCCYPLLVVTSFDVTFSKSIGIATKWWDRFFLLLLITNIVLLFKIIGAPLVVGLLVIPSATAYLVTNSLPTMLFYALLIAWVMAVQGYLLAYLVNGSVSGAMASVGGVLFLVVFLLLQLERIFGKKLL